VPPLPKWLEALRKEPRTTEAGIRWFPPEETEAKRAELVRWYTEGDARVRHHLPDAAFTAAQALASRFLPVAEGPAAVDRLGTRTRCWLLLDKQSQAELKVALSPVHPPFLWLGAGQTIASLQEALAPYFPAHVPSEDKLERTLRGYLGTGSGDKLDLYQLHDRYKASAFLDGVAWGSVAPKDPFQDMLEKGASGQDRARRYREQAPGARPSFSFRSLFSKSVLRAEAHVGVWQGVDLYIGQIRYRPAHQAQLIRELNQQLGTKHPEDLPVDLAGALIGLRFDPPERIREALQKPTTPSHLTFGLLCLDSLASDNATAEGELRPYAAHTDLGVRQVVANLALRRGLKGLLAEMAGRETHPELKKQLSEATQRLGPQA
jgi:hypothetical protein